ncbi:MAG: kelch repeat-containing protein [Bacteroidia bacterium]
MKNLITSFIFCFLFGECFPQAGEWTWIKGDSIPNQAGSYGVQGVPSPTNNPPSLYEPCEWTDLNGNFWLFGGGNLTVRNDLWKFNPLFNEWTWMKGSGMPYDSGSFGIQGVPSPTNNPPALSWAMASWTDNIGNLWMFGGTNSNGTGGVQNALWKYNISSNEWTWMKGSDSLSPVGFYGIQGISAPTNNPSGRNESAAAWTDDTGDLWLFGGNYFNTNNGISYNLNDLWRYNISSNQWTWIKGSEFQNQAGTYGVMGVENIINTPEARMVYSHWKDVDGNLWLFGGRDTDVIFFNDFWKYNINSNNWAWMGGDSSGNAISIYGTKCLPSFNNMPGARFENRAEWKDQSGNFWFFGGGDGIGGSFSNLWNDLWQYCFATNKWIWINGDNISNPLGNWGTLGTSSPTNKPNGRGGAVGWSDNNGHFYMFGGTNLNGGYNDLWKFTVDITCGVCPTSTSIQENNFNNELLVFPNPTNSSITISFQSSSNQTIELRIYNTLGKQIYLEKAAITAGKYEKEINVKKLSDGIYFLQVKMKEGNINRKVIINH